MSKDANCSLTVQRRNSQLEMGRLLVIGTWVISGWWWSSLEKVQADEGDSWMISGRIVSGLTSGGVRPEETESDREWLADSDESNWQYIVIHHSATGFGSVQQIDEEHRRRKDTFGNPWLGVGYHFVIGNGKGMKDGAVESTFRWEEQLHGAHSGNAMFNARGIGICLIGDFEQTPPTKAQMKSVRNLTSVLATRHDILRENIIGHASVKKTACPGKYFPLNELRQVISK